MGKEKVLFESEERRDLRSVAAFLCDLADKMEANAVVLRKGDEEIPVEIPNNVEFEIKLEEEEKKGGRVKRSLEVEIEWIVGESNEPVSLA